MVADPRSASLSAAEQPGAAVQGAPDAAATSPLALRLCTLVADVFQIGDREVTVADGMQTIEQWDSINHLNLVLALENEFGTSFVPEETDRLVSVASILEVLEARIGIVRPAGDVPASPLAVRALEPGDMPAVVSLLCQRDAVGHEPQALARYLCGLDPRQVIGWMALFDGCPIGLTVLCLRDVHWGDEVRRAGYWSHLYVVKEHRKALAYEGLVHAMMNESRAAGVEVVYTGTRRPAVADSHTRIGFTELGKIGVRIKPLRPFRLLGRHRGWGALDAVSPPLDILYRFGEALLRGPSASRWRIQATTTDSPHVDAFLRLLEAQSGSRIRQTWTTAAWRRRFSATLEGWPYTLLVALDGNELAGGLLLRSAVRTTADGVTTLRFGVVMDIVDRARDGAVTRHLLAEAEDRSFRDGCHGMLWLDGVAELAGRMAGAGYRETPETYTMLVWPPASAPAGSRIRDLENWRFPFSEHDAF